MGSFRFQPSVAVDIGFTSSTLTVRASRSERPGYPIGCHTLTVLCQMGGEELITEASFFIY